MRVALADDSCLFRHGLALLLETMGIAVVAQAGTGAELLRRVEADPPDVAILDIRMPPTYTDEGLRAAEALRQRQPAVGLLLLSTYAETPYATRLFGFASSGVGYLLKDRVDNPQTLRDALHRVAGGDRVLDSELVSRLVGRQRETSQVGQLTERERAVLRLMAEGRSNLGIGQSLRLSPKTVEAHVAAVLSKLGLPPTADDNRRVLAVLAWLRATGVTA